MDLESFRKARGLTQQQLAEAIGLRSKGSISMVERGIRDPSADLAIRLEHFSGGVLKAVDLRPDLADVTVAGPAEPSAVEVTA